MLISQLRQADERLVDLALKETPARLANLILQLMEDEDVVVTREGYKIPTRYTHQRLGRMIGASRVAVTRACKKLKEIGAAKLKHRSICIRDAEALKRAAAGH